MLTTAQIDETLIYYDRPLLFTSIGSDGQKYLVVLSEEKADGSEVWLAAAITDECLVQLKSGEIEFRAGFAGSPCVAVTVGADGSVSETALDTVPDKWLPDEGIRL